MSFLDNLAIVLNNKLPEYDSDWANDSGDNSSAYKVYECMDKLVDAVTDDLLYYYDYYYEEEDEEDYED